MDRYNPAHNFSDFIFAVILLFIAIVGLTYSTPLTFNAATRTDELVPIIGDYEQDLLRTRPTLNEYNTINQEQLEAPPVASSTDQQHELALPTVFHANNQGGQGGGRLIRPFQYSRPQKFAQFAHSGSEDSSNNQKVQQQPHQSQNFHSWHMLFRPGMAPPSYNKRVSEREINSLLKNTWVG